MRVKVRVGDDGEVEESPFASPDSDVVKMIDSRGI